MPTIVLFYQQSGLSIRDIFILQSIYSISIIVMEIPTGYFADVLGRKLTVLISCILSFLGLLIYSFAHNFWSFVAAELTIGFGSSFLSGTDSALLYESLAELDEEERYKFSESRMQSISHFSESIASVLGSVVASYGLRKPFYIETALLFLSIPFALLLKEPVRERVQNKRNLRKEILKIVKYTIHDHAEVKWLVCYSGTTVAATLTAVWLVQPFLNQMSVPLVFFGIIWAALNAFVGFSSFYSHKYEELIGRRLTLISLILIACLGYLLLGISSTPYAITFFFLFYMVRGFSGPILDDYVNTIITSNMRATVLSVKSLAGRLLFVIVGPFIGWITDVYSLQAAILASGGIFCIMGFICLLFLHKNHAL